jgi:hypothetical protein
LRYLYMLYKHTTQKLYIYIYMCDPQMQLNNFFTLPKIALQVVYLKNFLSIVYIQIKKQ